MKDYAPLSAAFWAPSTPFEPPMLFSEIRRGLLNDVRSLGELRPHVYPTLRRLLMQVTRHAAHQHSPPTWPAGTNAARGRSLRTTLRPYSSCCASILTLSCRCSSPSTPPPRAGARLRPPCDVPRPAPVHLAPLPQSRYLCCRPPPPASPRPHRRVPARRHPCRRHLLSLH